MRPKRRPYYSACFSSASSRLGQSGEGGSCSLVRTGDRISTRLRVLLRIDRYSHRTDDHHQQTHPEHLGRTGASRTQCEVADANMDKKVTRGLRQQGVCCREDLRRLASTH